MLITPAVSPVVFITPTPAIVEAVAKPQAENSQSDTQDKSHDGHKQDELHKQSAHHLTDQERAEAQRLAQRDREVRAHEAAHKGAAGRYARGGAEFEYERGPDGRQYAVGGEVSIDVSRPSDPREALQKAMLIRRAALAPAQPSAQDRSVAAEATQMEQQAKSELLKQRSAAADEAVQEENSKALSSLERAYRGASQTDNPSINITV